MMNRIFILGNLNIDYTIKPDWFQNGHLMKQAQADIGGTAYNAARAFIKAGYNVYVVGNTGDDEAGELIVEALKKAGINFIIDKKKDKPTGCCHVILGKNQDRLFIKDTNDANHYDTMFLQSSLQAIRPDKNDCILAATHFLYDENYQQARKIMNVLQQFKTKIALDFVPHTLYKKFSINQFKGVLTRKIEIIITEYKTLCGLLGEIKKTKPNENDWKTFFKEINTDILVLRYGNKEISEMAYQQIRKRSDNKTNIILQDEIDTGHIHLAREKQKGFGDRLTVDFFNNIYQKQ